MNKEMFKYLKDITVLYVEDDKNIQEELEIFLKRRVKKLVVASDGEEGLNIYKDLKPDLVITDVQMPKMDGITMSKYIKEISPSCNIVIITAFNDTDYLFDAIKLNINNYLTKPLDLQMLMESISSIAKNISLEKENKEIYNTLKQYKDIVDERSIISKMDCDGYITYVNKPFEKISGYSKEELIGKYHTIINSDNIEENLPIEIWDVIKNKKESWQGRISKISKTGHKYFVDMLIKPIVDLDGEVEEFISLSYDITDLELSKEYFKNQTQIKSSDLNESIRIAELYKKAIDESNIILRLDLNRNITYANEAFYKISGYAKEELINKPYTTIKNPHMEHEQYNEMINEITTGNIWKGKISNVAKDGSSFHCNITVFPLKDKNGNITEYMGVRHDITELENLYKELEDTQREVIYKLGEVAEQRSKETANHVKRVAEYSRFLSKIAGLNENDTNMLFTASPMHDIGKIGIPDSILHKPDKLNDAEWEIMKTHCEIGHNILNSSKRPILKAAAIISYTHHEKWDGTGYPLGLKGEDIHIFGRIIAIADVFDALVSRRVYKNEWPIEEIREFFNEQKGKHFDPNLVDLFINNINEFIEISDKYKD